MHKQLIFFHKYQLEYGNVTFHMCQFVSEPLLVSPDIGNVTALYLCMYVSNIVFFSWLFN